MDNGSRREVGIETIEASVVERTGGGKGRNEGRKDRREKGKEKRDGEEGGTEEGGRDEGMSGWMEVVNKFPSFYGPD